MAKVIINYSGSERQVPGRQMVGIWLGRISLMLLVLLYTTDFTLNWFGAGPFTAIVTAIGNALGGFVLILAAVGFIASMCFALLGLLLSNFKSVCGWIVVLITGIILGLLAWSTINYRW